MIIGITLENLLEQFYGDLTFPVCVEMQISTAMKQTKKVRLDMIVEKFYQNVLSHLYHNNFICYLKYFPFHGVNVQSKSCQLPLYEVFFIRIRNRTYCI